MNKKLRTMIVTILSITMLMGMSISVYAEDPEGPAGLPDNTPESVNCVNGNHNGYEHFYVTSESTYISLDDPEQIQYVEGRMFNTAGEIVGDYYKGSGYFLPLSAFENGALNGTGWYYCNNDVFRKCTSPSNNYDLCEPSSAAHTHDFHWTIVVEPSKESDGLEQEVCACGAVRNIQKISAYGYTIQSYATPMIINAKPGETVEMDFGEFNSFSKNFMEKVAEKSKENVSFGFHYNWNQIRYDIRIPAGTEINTDFDWYGPAKMADLYKNSIVG